MEIIKIVLSVEVMKVEKIELPSMALKFQQGLRFKK
jgi:hypothetical protein